MVISGASSNHWYHSDLIYRSFIGALMFGAASEETAADRTTMWDRRSLPHSIHGAVRPITDLDRAATTPEYAELLVYPYIDVEV